jgi:hypothetical protein
MKWVWIPAVLLVAVLVKGVSSGALSGPSDIPRQALAYERAIEAQGKLRVARPKIERAGETQQSAAAGAVMSDARIVAGEPQPESAPRKWAKVTGNVVNVRMQPDLSAAAVTTHTRDTALQVLRERGEWRLVLDPDTRTSGWMHADYLDVTDNPQVTAAADPRG